MIEHAPGIYSLSAHLRQGSILVKAGQAVSAGQKIGECGNSGNSSEPHLHFHLQDNSVFTVFDRAYSHKPLAQGVKPYFVATVSKKGKQAHMAHYSPVKGDVLVH